MILIALQFIQIIKKKKNYVCEEMLWTFLNGGEWSSNKYHNLWSTSASKCSHPLPACMSYSFLHSYSVELRELTWEELVSIWFLVYLHIFTWQCAEDWSVSAIHAHWFSLSYVPLDHGVVSVLQWRTLASFFWGPCLGVLFGSILRISPKLCSTLFLYCDLIDSDHMFL